MQRLIKDMGIVERAGSTGRQLAAREVRLMSLEDLLDRRRIVAAEKVKLDKLLDGVEQQYARDHSQAQPGDVISWSHTNASRRARVVGLTTKDCSGSGGLVDDISLDVVSINKDGQDGGQLKLILSKLKDLVVVKASK